MRPHSQSQHRNKLELLSELRKRCSPTPHPSLCTTALSVFLARSPLFYTNISMCAVRTNCCQTIGGQTLASEESSLARSSMHEGIITQLQIVGLGTVGVFTPSFRSADTRARLTNRRQRDTAADTEGRPQCDQPGKLCAVRMPIRVTG